MSRIHHSKVDIRHCKVRWPGDRAAALSKTSWLLRAFLIWTDTSKGRIQITVSLTLLSRYYRAKSVWVKTSCTKGTHACNDKLETAAPRCKVVHGALVTLGCFRRPPAGYYEFEEKYEFMNAVDSTS